MNPILTCVIAVMFASAASSQVLSEDFSSGTPPTGWTVVDNTSSGVVGWEPGYFDFVDHTGWALHDYDTLFAADTLLVSPVMNLSTVNGTTLSFLTETDWVDYMAHNPFSVGNGVSTAEISTDGGLTWTVVWTDNVLIDYNPVVITLDLSAYDGMAAVQVAFRYFGIDAHTWWIDNVLVDGGAGPNYTIAGLVGGSAVTLTVSGATAGGGVLIGYSLAGAGPTMTPFGPVDISTPITQLPVLTANAAGVASLSTQVPPRATGFTLYTQGADLTTATLTNSLAEPVL